MLCFAEDGHLKTAEDLKRIWKEVTDEAKRRNAVVERLLNFKDLWSAGDDLLLPLMSLFVYVSLEPRTAYTTLVQFVTTDTLSLQTMLGANTLATLRVFTAHILMGKGFQKQWFLLPDMKDPFSEIATVTSAEMKTDAVQDAMTKLTGKLKERFAWIVPEDKDATEDEKEGDGHGDGDGDGDDEDMPELD